jgi:hypothetical protein
MRDKSGTPEIGQAPYKIRLPRFVSDTDAEVALGDAIKRVTHALGIRACGGCERRSTALNRWVAFTRPGK